MIRRVGGDLPSLLLMASNNVRSFRGKKPFHKSPDGQEADSSPAEERNELSLSPTGLIDVSVILEVIPYPVALWSLDRRSCIFNHPTRELLGFSDDDFIKNGSLWMDHVHPQDQDVFASAWRKLQAGEKKIGCRYRFFPKNE